MGIKLGQHFLTRPETARAVATSLALPEHYTVLEIGPGRGILTKELLACGYRVVALEKDTQLVKVLHETFATECASGQLILFEEDVRSFDIETNEHIKDPYALIANIPYYITGHIVRMFLTAQNQPTHMAILMQREVAERIVAKNNKHSILSLSVQLYGTPTIKKIIKPGAFSPPPTVDSALLTISNITREHVPNPTFEMRFFTIVKKAFSQKRKTIGATLKGVVEDDVFAQCGVPKSTRPEDVPIKQWLCMAEYDAPR